MRKLILIFICAACGLSAGNARADFTFYNTFWLDMSVGRFWGISYLCGVDSQYTDYVTCSVGNQIQLCAHGRRDPTARVPGGVAHVAVSVVPVGFEAFGGSGVYVITQTGHLVVGDLPTVEPVPDAQGSIDLCTMTWTDYGPVPTGGALEIALTDSNDVFILGLDHVVYTLDVNQTCCQWPAVTTGANVAEIAWSPSRRSLFTVTTTGVVSEGKVSPMSGGPVQWTDQTPVEGLPYCGSNPTTVSCIASIGGNALAIFTPDNNGGSFSLGHYDLLDLESAGPDGGEVWTTQYRDVGSPLSGALVKVLEGGSGPHAANAVDAYWVLGTTQRVDSFER